VILKELNVNQLVPTDRTLVIPIGPVPLAITGMLAIINLTAAGTLDFFLFTDDQYNRLPNSLPMKQWVGSRLELVETLPGKGPFFLMVANSKGAPIQLVGKVSFGGQ